MEQSDVEHRRHHHTVGHPRRGRGGINPDTTETDLHQPGTEPLMDPATVKAVASESATLSPSGDTDKG